MALCLSRDPKDTEPEAGHDLVVIEDRDTGAHVLTVQVVRGSHRKVRLAFTASASLVIRRGELPPRPRRGVGENAELVRFPHGKPAAPPAAKVG